ncbi:MAG: ribonuclease D [Desulfobacterales bacterium]|nr:ribonuclease D [Desulfobacterales bacterium]
MNEAPFTNYTLIETLPALEAAARELEKEPIVAVDLEADSMYHYKEKVCLVQIATRRLNLVVDPIAVHDLSSLKPFFSNPDIRKVFHGSDYDVRSLYRDFHIEINNLFDTQQACMFLGERETGLDSALQRRFGVALNKKYQRKDWSMRPLPPDMIEYAAMDSLHLIPLARMVEKELKEMGRLSWVLEECELLSKVRPAPLNDGPLFAHFKGAGRLSPRDLAVLEALLEYRNALAKRKDRPLFKILGSDALLRIVNARPENLKQLARSRALSKRQISMYGNGIKDAVARAMNTPREELPVFPRGKAPFFPPIAPDRIKELKAWRDQKADELGIDPGILFNKALLIAVSHKDPRAPEDFEDIDGFKNWQKEAFGEEILRVLKKCEPKPKKKKKKRKKKARNGSP